MSAPSLESLRDRWLKAAGLTLDLEVLRMPSGVAAFHCAVEGVEVQFHHAPEQPDLVHVLALVGPATAYRADVGQRFAEMNAMLLADEQSICICRQPVLGDYMARIRLPFHAASSGRWLLDQVLALVRAVKGVRDDIAEHALAPPCDREAGSNDH